ncbi:MAG: hypothetical protein DVS81_14585 [Candidatus Accumulibacter meliphilus]|uniref:Uncharacterized protein n=1 Tax=Candidatus Accumulibacter meliphilus TaxID=2211374 RepID=A0A369XQU5_9PROT|nr:MAG: hypothetical protein DVS81_14585 [Candidatus Accumulibacter meliphilus]
MSRSAALRVATLAAVYALWLASWIIFGPKLYGADRYFWSDATAAAVTGSFAFYLSRRTSGPYPAFLALLGVAFWLLAASWVSYPTSSGQCEAVPIVGRLLDAGACGLLTNAIYALCVFTLMCAWSYLALDRWQLQRLSALTGLVFAALMMGLGAIFGMFYSEQYAHQMNASAGRLNAVVAALEFAVVVAGLLSILLRVPPLFVWMLVGTVILMVGDMADGVGTTQSAGIQLPIIDAIWMFGQLLILATMLVIPETHLCRGSKSAPGDDGDPHERSGLSGILILLSLGTVLLAPLVWFLPIAGAWKHFFSALLVIALVIVLVWITDRFDDTVDYLRAYVRQAHESQLVSRDWRDAPLRIRQALSSTGLGAFVEEFRASAQRLKQDVLFLGPERLYGLPRALAEDRASSCFIVMPFGQEWSPAVHRILAAACEAAGARAVRGDDLFTPTDILEDIWQSINAADFVIADITGRNPNVLYELGIAHTLAKPVLILSRDANDIPIDLATRRVILYGESVGDWHDDLTQKMSTAIAALVEDYGLTKRAP